MTLEELREACAKWFETHADDATLDTTGVERKTLLWVAKKLRTFPLPSSAPVDDEFAGHTPGPWDYRVKTGAITDRDGAGLANVESGDAHEVDANGHLMAAAPRLLRERDEARKERDEALDKVSRLRDQLEPLVTAQDATLRRSARREEKLRAEVASLTAALAAAHRERDEARVNNSAYTSDGRLICTAEHPWSAAMRVQHTGAVDAGECIDGCCDRFRCKHCGHEWNEELGA